MTTRQANHDSYFEDCPPGYVLQENDRMKRGLGTMRNSGDWFPLADFDIGQPAAYFNSGGFIVQRRKTTAPPLK